MATHDYVIANQSHSALRADLNNVLSAILTRNSGTTAAIDAAATEPHMVAVDTTLGVVKRRNAADSGWLYESTIDETRVLARSSNTILDESDIGKLLLTTGSFTQTLTAAATLKDGWWIRFRNNGTGVLTFNPNGAELVDGASTLAIGPGVSGILVCDGTGFYTVGASRALPAAVSFGSSVVLAANTSNGSDNLSFSLAAGGAADNTRGGYLYLSGNENAATGEAHLASGDVAGATLQMFSGTAMLRINRTAGASYSPTNRISTNAKNVNGFTIDQAAGDDEILSLKSSDVAHGVTGTTETDTYGFLKKASATAGGLQIAGVSENATVTALQFLGVGDTTTTKSTAGTGIFSFDAYENDGTATAAAVTADSNLLVVRANTTTRFILDADGDSHQDVGTAWTNFDAHDDIALLDSLSVNVSAKRDPIRKAFGRLLTVNRKRLEELELVRFNRNGHHFVNMSRLTMLLTGAVRQLGREQARMQKLLAATAA